jgi:1-acyl-sn-glycerol-3-phosphate acyltransferase
VPDLSESPLTRLARVPREPDLLCYAFRAAAAIAMRTVLRVYHRFEIEGRANLPTDGASYVLVANHASHLDGLCLLSAVPFGRIHRAYPVAARDYFFRSPASTALAATLINALPFDRAGNVRHSMATCRELLLQDGNVLIVFPEGTRSTSGAIGPFRRGIGDLVAGTNVPVVPCYLDGTREAMPKGGIVPRPRRVRLVIGSPRTYSHVAPCKSSARAIGEDLRRAVLALSPSAVPDQAEGGLYDGCRSPTVTAAVAAAAPAHHRGKAA